jgi:hypothetical protein
MALQTGSLPYSKKRKSGHGLARFSFFGVLSGVTM